MRALCGKESKGSYCPFSRPVVKGFLSIFKAFLRDCYPLLRPVLRCVFRDSYNYLRRKRHTVARAPRFPFEVVPESNWNPPAAVLKHRQFWPSQSQHRARSTRYVILARTAPSGGPQYEAFSFAIVPNWRLIHVPYVLLKMPLKALFV